MKLSTIARPVVVACSLLLLVGATPADARPIDGHPRQAVAWLSDELGTATHFSAYGYADWGLTIDTAFAMVATGDPRSKLDQVSDGIEAHYWSDYISYGGVFYANSAAKALTAARVLGRPARDFAGHNLRAKVLSMVAGAGAGLEAGHVRDTDWDTATDYSNSIGQAFAVIGLARSGGVPQSVVDYLARQQCASGGFTLYVTAGQTCDEAASTADVDTTGLALQALVVAKRAGATVPSGSIHAAASWLRSIQKRNGGFASGDGSGRPNANSTGYAAAGLDVIGRDRAVRRAARFVASLQLVAKHAGAASGDLGAIAFNRAALRAAKQDGVTDATRDQFRRATAQAIFALVGKNLAGLHRR